MKFLHAFFPTAFLVYRAHTHGSLTPAGIVAAVITAITHASHPSSLPFVLLLTFYFLGNTATKIKKDIKEQLVLQNDGGHGHSQKKSKSAGSTGRGITQVICNSGIASVLCLLDLSLRLLHPELHASLNLEAILLLGIISNYASTTSDTLSSELGILSPTRPFLITAPLSCIPCPPGTNGAVSPTGLFSGLLGSLTIALVSSLYFDASKKLTLILFGTTIGFLGTILDSILGALFQPTILDTKTGKVVENPHGGVVLIQPSSSTGRGPFTIVHRAGGGEIEKRDDNAPQNSEQEKDTKDKEATRKMFTQGGGRFFGVQMTNNEVNVSMAGIMSLVGMIGWWVLKV